jgi:hypothetical protein
MNKILSFLTFLLPVAVFGQATQNAATPDTVIKSVTTKLNNYAANHSIEKVYLQFDKPYYAIKDTIYFKAYLTLGAQHKLSALSRVLYTELIGPDNKVAQSIKLPVIAGVAWGDFPLDESIKAGAYRIRTYTNWMRNEGNTAYFDQAITIAASAEAGTAAAKSQSSTVAGKKNEQTKIDVQFLPEGGNFVAGNYSKMAFKAIGPDGLGKEIKGTITDNDGTEVTTFASAHLGMGAFNIVPHAGVTYKANITYEDGTTSTVELPKAVNTGYTITVNDKPDTLRIRIAAGSETPQGPVNLAAQSGGAVYYAAQSGQFTKFFTAVIPKSKFPTGIVQFTVFSQSGEPLNERLMFIQHRDGLKLDVNTKAAYTFRQKMKIELNAKDKNGKPVNGSFSVAVTDETRVPVAEPAENTIMTNLLLTSDLKGSVEQPNYYFTNVSEKTSTDLDLLMLTQGYRHFTWKQVLTDNGQAAAFQPEKGMVISGLVKRGGKPAAGAKLSLISKAGGFTMIDTVADQNGRFAFHNLSFIDSTKFVVQSRVDKGQDNVTLKLDSAIYPQVEIKPIAVPSNGTDAAAYAANQKHFFEEQQKAGIGRVQVLKEVTIKGDKINPIPHSQNLNGAGNADQVISSKDIARFNCARIVDCLSGVLTGVVFRNGAPLTTRGSQAPMAIVIDGNFSEAADLDNLNPDDIEGVEVLLGGHYSVVYGTRMANGGLIITTKVGRKDREYYRYAPGVVTFRPKGFYKAREFYSPQYDNSKTNKNITDLRSTIFWKPDIITDKNGKASFTFFNADSKGTYRLVIEGIDTEGNIGRQVVKYNVE